MPVDEEGGEASAPLLIDMHSFMDNGYRQRRRSGTRAVAASRGYAVAYPHGFRNSWNAGWCCGWAVSAGTQDVEFVAGLRAQTLVTHARIDPRRVWLTGHSNGCMMAQRLALEVRGAFAAVACSSGYLEAGASENVLARYRREPTAIMTAHALDDPTVPYESIESKTRGKRQGIGGPDERFSTALGNIEGWRDRNGCGAAAHTLWANASGRLIRYDNCTRGREVEHLALASGGHLLHWTAPQLASVFQGFYSRFSLDDNASGG